MSELKKEIIENGIHYTLIGDYYFPDFAGSDVSVKWLVLRHAKFESFCSLLTKSKNSQNCATIQFIVNHKAVNAPGGPDRQFAVWGGVAQGFNLNRSTVRCFSAFS